VNRSSITPVEPTAKVALSVGWPSTWKRSGRRVEALLTRAADRDGSFRAHSANVAAISVRVGEELGLCDDELETLDLAAEVHDVGKLCVPASVLSKPGRLDEEEWDAMRRHPEAGAELLGTCAVRTEVLEIVRSHHERWDGAGYPDGLRGPQIPLGARIIAVADAYCAMLESRPYRPPRRMAVARAELLAHAGTQFDATCAQAAYRIVALR